MTRKITGFFKLLIAAQFVLVAAQAGAGHHESKAESKDIVDTAVAAGSFNTLVTAVKAAGRLFEPGSPLPEGVPPPQRCCS